MSFWLLTDKKIMVIEFKYTNLANCGLRKSVAQLFNSLKHYKQFSPLCQKFGLCDMCPFHFHTFKYIIADIHSQQLVVVF
jgi:hypothetical protein